MFKRILVPLPMENIPEKATRRAGELADLMGSDIYVTYILEDEVFNEVEKHSTHVITSRNQESFMEGLKKVHRDKALNLVRPEVDDDLGRKPEDFLVKEGTYHQVILDMINEMDIDLVMMEYHSFNFVKYRIMDRSPVPIWIVRHDGEIGKIGLFCTNLAPNRRAPRVAKKLAKTYGCELVPYYIKDASVNSGRNEPELIEKRSGIKFSEIVEGDLENELSRISKGEGFDMIVLGRIKKIGFFDLRSRFAKRTKCSVLLIN